jgi:hypothetical protein
MAAVARIAFALLLAASAAFAESITFVPPNPTPSTSIDAVVRGSTSGCPARLIDVATSGSTITLRLTYDFPPDSGCTAAILPFTLTFHLGMLPAGSYTVIARHEGTTIPTREIARTTLIVRDAEALLIRPYAVPTTGGKVAIYFFPGGTVTLDGVSVPATTTPEGLLVFDAPPHAAGAVDVTVTTPTATRTAKAGLIYFEPGTTPAAVFEPILFPVAFEGPGAFGSQWTTENYVSGPGTAFFRDEPPFAPGPRRLVNDNQSWGRVLYAMRGTIDNTFFASRARDLSRQAQSAGVEIPVVRERDFRLTPVELLNVPNDARFRAMIRIWTMEDTGSVGLQIGTASQFVPTTRIPSAAISFASADITSMLRAAPAGSSVRVYGINGSSPPPYVFAMITITNNETQEVTVISSR